MTRVFHHGGLYLLLLALSANVAFAQPELPGVGLDRTRVVYTDTPGQRGESVTFNNNSDNDYLVQSWVIPPDGMVLSPAALASVKTDNAPFFVVPPLVRLDAHGRQVLRLLKKQGSLPQDRESVFLLVVKAIPNTPVVAQDKNNRSSAGALRLAMASTVKLFYRPAALPATGIPAVAKTLRFSRSAGDLVVGNPSPFYLTFAALEVGGKRLDGDAVHWMVPPRGEMRYPLPAGAAGKVRWSLLNERGEPTPWAQAALP
ncbi:molecular chaperone [Serratia quinivorans]|uniref:fimbrial biogenesis chaperone n=1 Tax=Serratia quinivorans TaxID=137545 RepID=UPI002E79DF3A|nr:molecular chaperone [Serratia quinivorans]